MPIKSNSTEKMLQFILLYGLNEKASKDWKLGNAVTVPIMRIHRFVLD